MRLRVVPAYTPYLICDKHFVTRADSVDCAVRMPGSVLFTVDSVQARGNNTGVFPDARRVGTTVAVGQSFQWSGPIVTATLIRIAVSFDSGGVRQRRSLQDSIAVNPRLVGDMFATPDANPKYDTATFATGQSIQDPPRNGVLGVTQFLQPDDTNSVMSAVRTVMAGPDSGLAYLNVDAIREIASLTLLHPGLKGEGTATDSTVGKAWYNAQNGAQLLTRPLNS
jgi:hypothetical protein